MFHWQLLGLHRLANDDSGMPADDLALPTGSSVMKRQLAYRLWLCLLSADMMASATGRQPLSTSPSRTGKLIGSSASDIAYTLFHYRHVEVFAQLQRHRFASRLESDFIRQP